MTLVSHPWARFLLRRLGLTLLVLWGLATLVFVMVKLIPGDEAQVAAGADASPAEVEAVRQRLGLDAPTIIQYFRFLDRAVHGDLGTSITSFQPVTADLARVLPSTVELVFCAMVINLAVAIPLGVWAASRHGGISDGLLRMSAVVVGGLPTFWLALVLQYLMGTVWHVLPISGQHAYGMAAQVRTGAPLIDALLAGDGESFRDGLSHIVLPAVVLALLFMTQIFRVLRSTLLAVLESDFIIPVRAKGASPARVLLRHALPNGLSPVLTLAGTQIGAMLGSTVLVETVFARQGVGSYLTNAVAEKDTYAVLGTVLFVGATVSVINLLIDFLQLLLDPRIRAAQLGEAAA